MLGTLFCLGGCVYRFTNLATRPPAGVQSVAVEAVYDTSREVIPHDILWESLQRAFAENGRLYLTPVDEADALIRVHVTNAAVGPSGAVSRTGPERDPNLSVNSHPAPGDFMDLSKASEFTNEQALTIVIKVEVINLKTRDVIKTATYLENATFKSYRDKRFTQASTAFLLSEEALNSRFKDLSQRVSRKIVTDLFL